MAHDDRVSEEEAARVLGMYFRAEAIAKILDERIPGFDGRTVREIAQHEPDRFNELLERLSSFVPTPDEMELGKLLELVMLRTALGRNIDCDTRGLLASDVVSAIIEVDSELYELVERRFKSYAQSSLDGHGYLPWGL